MTGRALRASIDQTQVGTLQEVAGRNRVAEGRYSTNRAEHVKHKKRHILALAKRGVDFPSIALAAGLSLRSVQRVISKRAQQPATTPLSQNDTSARLVFTPIATIALFKDIEWARSLRAKGRSVRQVAEITGIPKSSVARLDLLSQNDTSAPLVCGRSPTR